MKRIVCGMSGGVDSSVAALLLKKKGFNVMGVFMRNWDSNDESGEGVCTADQDLEDARKVCERIKIPLQEVNFVREYWNEVFSELVEDYRAGLTPNPDILCNRHIKFGSFYKYATQVLKADAIATGHYARTSFGNFLENWTPDSNVKLLTSEDMTKDQTLFLSRVPQETLRRTMFPLGEMTKLQVRQTAVDHGLSWVSAKKSSKGICFIGFRQFSKFIEDYIEPKAGNFIDVDTEEIVGSHTGIHKWTLGQRCRISGKSTAYFVAKKLLDTHDILVAPGHDHPALYTKSFRADAPYWIAGNQSNKFHCGEYKFRFQQLAPLMSCTLSVKDGVSSVTLETPQRALTPGQYAVFYRGNECLGSSRIISTEPSAYEDDDLTGKSEEKCELTRLEDTTSICL